MAIQNNNNKDILRMYPPNKVLKAHAKKRKQKQINRGKREHPENKRKKLLKSCFKQMKFQFVFKSGKLKE